MNVCMNCATETNNGKYCSRSCAIKVNNRTPKRKKKNPISCAQCSKETYNTRFCSNTCQHDYYSSQKIARWVAGDHSAMTTPTGYLSNTARVLLLKSAGHKCSLCGWDKKNVLTNKCPLEIDHINGDPTDNRMENLRVLCPNCHSLAPTARALNSSRSRQKYGMEQLSRERARPNRNQ